VGEGRPRIVYANSIQVGNGTPYAIGKAGASDVLGEATAGWGRPTPTCGCRTCSASTAAPRTTPSSRRSSPPRWAGETPGSLVDRPIGLLHAQNAAQALLDGLDASGVSEPVPYETSVARVWDTLAEFRSTYAGADVPDVTDDFRLDLFNTYRAALFPSRYRSR